ncbi:class F sortase [Streptomyces sp. NPDC020681]|uniref:class F sortase n=1 Tax=Streptomyces sp. NPDC020681 TaxID=3365083 RepID=UPI0037A7DAE1
MHLSSRRGSWFTLVCLLLLGLFLVREGFTGTDQGPPRPGAAVAADHRAAGPLPRAPGPLPHSPPRRITVPSIRLDAPLTGVGLDSDGWVEPPPLADNNLAGWYRGAVTPGERGTSVVVGHVDNSAGPAVFYLLGALERGSRVQVAREDGRTAVFSVYGVELYAKKDFPAARVYRDGADAELRLITCGGGYAEKTGYDGNVVVFARLVDVR